MHSSNINNPMSPRAVVILLPVILSLTAGMFLSCSRKPEPAKLSSADSLMVVKDNIAHRSEVDNSFRYDEGSPFKRDTTIKYRGIKWFPIDTRYRGISQLHRYVNAETVIVLGTKGEERKQLRYGYFTVTVPDDNEQPIVLKINVYKFTPYDAKRYALYRDALSVWFTDETTGKETYGVGRYVDVGNEDADPDHPYVIDFNKAYNPYCAYSNLFSCAVPRKEDHLDIALRVGEMKYHE
jgi:uncharacterized protein (DUF1684 family)